MSKIWKIAAGLLLAFLAIVVVLSVFAKPAPAYSFFDDGVDKPVVYAHRGGKGLWPENTLFAFQNAADLGVDVLEMDVHLSKDDVLVVIHDSTVDRTTDGSGEVKNLTLEELQSLDAGYRWTDDNGKTYRFRGLGLTIPTLEEVLKVLPEMRLNIEIKPDSTLAAEKLCLLLRKYDSTERVLIASFHTQAIRAFRESCPEVATAGGEDEIRTFYILSLTFLSSTFSPQASAFQVPEYYGKLHVLTRKFIRDAQHKNISVIAWTINDSYTMRRLLEIGVDGIITDYPDLLLQVIDR